MLPVTALQAERGKVRRSFYKFLQVSSSDITRFSAANSPNQHKDSFEKGSGEVVFQFFVVDLGVNGCRRQAGMTEGLLQDV